MLRFILTLLLIGMVVAGCGSENQSRSTISILDSLKSKSNLYVHLIGKHQDSDGFILTDKCDSLLFTGLLSAARPDLDINMRAAQASDGSWHRRPGQDCGPSFENSRSTISRDMIIGLMWHIWSHKDLDMAIELMEDLKDNRYILKGEGTIGELLLTPAMINTLAQIIKALGGPQYHLEMIMPVTFGKGEGFVAHLTAWHIHLRGQVMGSISDGQLELLRYLKDKQPLNPLFVSLYHKYTDGNQGEAIKLLMNKLEWPSDRLPTTAEHCDAWPIERDYSEKDWGPCLPIKEHTGAELVTIYNLVIAK